MTTTENAITKDMTPAEAANLLLKLEEAHRTAWLSTRKAPWQSAEYEARFQNAAEVDGIFRDVMRETMESGMRRPGEPVELFAERAESETRLADAHKAGTDTAADLITLQADAGMTPETRRGQPERDRRLAAERGTNSPGPGVRQGVLGHRRDLREGAAGA